MDTKESRAGDGQNWDVYRDALVPVQDKPIPRPWERAPVSGHAPRLQGRQIWKKAGIRSRIEAEKENDLAQAELDSVDARKRMRIVGEKVNIGDARWLVDSGREDGYEAILGGEKKLEDVREEKELQYVPRKRTNTNHVITPRKPLRQTILNGTAKTQVLSIEAEKVYEKPARRRKKSMRKSLSTSMAVATDATPRPTASFQNTLTVDIHVKNNEDGPDPVVKNPDTQSMGLESKLTIQDGILPRRSLRTSLVGEVQDLVVDPSALSPASTQTLSDLQVTDTVNLQGMVTPQESKQRVEFHKSVPEPVKILLDGRDGCPTVSLEQDHAIATLKEKTETLANDILGTDTLRTDTLGADTFEGLGMPSQTLNGAPAILPSMEMGQPDSSQPLKVGGTPRKRKAPTTRRGTRRSTRTRASSAKSEEQPVQITTVPGVVEPEPSTTSLKLAEVSPTVNQRGTKRSARTRESTANTEEQLVRDTTALGVVEPTSASEPAEISPINIQLSVEEVRLSTDTSDVPALSEERVYSQEDQPESEASVREALELMYPAEGPTFSKLETAVSEVISEAEAEVAAVGFEEGPDKLTSGQLAIEEPDTFNVVHKTALGGFAVAEIPEVNLDDFDLSPPVKDSSKTRISMILPSVELEGESLGIFPGRSSPAQCSPTIERAISPALSDEQTVDILENLEPIFVPADQTLSFKLPRKSTEDLPETSTPDPSTSELIEAISENATTATYDHDDTDMLRNFLTRVKANKAAKAEKIIPKRKRSLPHSPLQIPLEEADANLSPSEAKENFDFSTSTSSPSNKKKKRNIGTEDELAGEPEPKSIRRSGRTRLPVVKPSVAAPSFIPVRRLGQDADATVTLRGSEEKELAALTRVNTRKNKAGALSPPEVLAKKVQEKDNPALRQRLLKEVFDEKALKTTKEKKRKSVAWAVEIAQYQEAGGKKLDAEKDVKDNEKGVEKKRGAVRVGASTTNNSARLTPDGRIKVDGTSTSKRKTKGKS